MGTVINMAATIGRLLLLNGNRQPWPAFLPRLTLADSQMVSGVTIILARGANLQVRLNDPGGILANVLNSNKPGTPLLTQVWEDRGFIHVVRMRSFDASGQNASMVVPF